MDIEVDLSSLVGEAVRLAPEAAFALFIDSASMHRDAAIEQRFSPEAAEAMAVALHSGLVALYFTSVQ